MSDGGGWESTETVGDDQMVMNDQLLCIVLWIQLW